jgi:hypothetical protein
MRLDVDIDVDDDVDDDASPMAPSGFRHATNTNPRNTARLVDPSSTSSRPDPNLPAAQDKHDATDREAPRPGTTPPSPCARDKTLDVPRSGTSNTARRRSARSLFISPVHRSSGVPV